MSIWDEVESSWRHNLLVLASKLTYEGPQIYEDDIFAIQHHYSVVLFEDIENRANSQTEMSFR